MELLVGKFDFDGSGAIEFNEFARLIRNAAPAPQPQIQSAVSLINTKLYSGYHTLEEAFRAMDTSGDGIISRARGVIENKHSTGLESSPPPAYTARLYERGVIENKHSTDVESPPPSPHVCMSGLLRTNTRPTLNVLLLIRASE